jgi:hypothetical protein
MITANLNIKTFRLKPSRKLNHFNAGLEARLVKYIEIIRGSKEQSLQRLFDLGRFRFRQTGAE